MYKSKWVYPWDYKTCKVCNNIITNVVKYTTYAGIFKYILSFSNLSDSLGQKIYSFVEEKKIEIKGKELPHSFTNYYNLKSIA